MRQRAGNGHTFENPHRSREIVNPPRRPQGSSDDGRTRHEIVGESVVEVSLYTISTPYTLIPSIPFRPPRPAPFLTLGLT